MKAAVYYGPKDIRIENRPEPVKSNDNIIVKVECCSICGTDLKIFSVGNPRCHPPRIIGHEMVGSIIHVGSNVEGYSPGERITLATTVSCGECDYCKANMGNLCPNAKPISYDFDGAFAEYIEIPPQAIKMGNMIKVPMHITAEVAALSEPVSCALNAQELVGFNKGDNVVIVGGGPLGAIHAELVKAQGAKSVSIIEIDEKRLKLLERIKNVTLINGSKVDAVAVVKEITNGMGADIVIVCAPAKIAMEQAIFYARKGGGVSYFASLPKGNAEITLDSRTIHYNELRIVGASDSRPEHVEKAVEYMADKKIDLSSLVTHKIALNDIHTGFELMKNKQSLKVLVYPEGV